MSSMIDNISNRSINKIGVLGAGLMGHGITHAIARSGLEVVMIDTTLDKVENALDRIKTILHNDLKKQIISQEEFHTALKCISISDDYDMLNGCNMIIEAVYEDRGLKELVISNADELLSKDAIFASNTSTIPISILAKATTRPKNFIGLHFFSPVNKMKLVEVIKGKETGSDTLSIALDFVRAIGKQPIVVNDGPGFFTTRVFQCYTNEGMAMLTEGIPPLDIERMAKEAGYPVGPLAILDEISINLASHIRDQIKKYSITRKRSSSEPWDKVIDLMALELGRTGRSTGAGFYEYPKNEKKYLWEELKDHFPRSNSVIGEKDVIDRFYFSQALETIRCFEEGIIDSYNDANTGSILGWGFPNKTGGVLNFVNDYGILKFKERSDELADQYGNRFNSPKLLKEMADSGKSF